MSWLTHSCPSSFIARVTHERQGKAWTCALFRGLLLLPLFTGRPAWFGLVWLYLTPGAEPTKDRRSLPKGMGRARLGTLCTCLLRMPAILSSRTKFKRPLNAEAEQPHSRSILPPPFVGSTLLSVPYSSERGDCCTEQISVEKVWAP